jgi:hypothetical protein
MRELLLLLHLLSGQVQSNITQSFEFKKELLSHKRRPQLGAASAMDLKSAKGHWPQAKKMLAKRNKEKMNLSKLGTSDKNSRWSELGTSDHINAPKKTFHHKKHAPSRTHQNRQNNTYTGSIFGSWIPFLLAYI